MIINVSKRILKYSTQRTSYNLIFEYSSIKSISSNTTIIYKLLPKILIKWTDSYRNKLTTNSYIYVFSIDFKKNLKDQNIINR